MVFLQSAAPTGWTQNTASTLANATLRVITSGSASTGGTDQFQSVFTSKSTSGSDSVSATPLTTSGGTVGATTLSTPQIASHTHTYAIGSINPGDPPSAVPHLTQSPTATNNPAGGDGSHTHPVSGTASFTGTIAAPSVSLSVPGMTLKHANVIVCSKD
jgi:hypothetical protein